MKKGLLVFALALALIAPASGSEAADPPPNDNRANATEITRLPAIGAISFGSTIEPGEDTTCTGLRGTVWFSYKSKVAQSINTTFSFVQIFKKTRNDFVSLGCVSSWQAEAGGHYFLQVGASTDFYQISGSAESSDFLDGAETILAPPFGMEEWVFGNSYTGNAPDPDCASASGGGGVWHTYTADIARVIDAEAFAADWVFMETFTRALDGSLVSLGCNATKSEYGTAGITTALAPGQQIWMHFGFDDDPENQFCCWGFPMIFTFRELTDV